MMRSLAAFLLLVVSAGAQKHLLVDVRASGSEHFEPTEIIAASGLPGKGKEVTLAAVRDAAQKLTNTGVFKEISYRHTAAPGGMRVAFIVKDHDDEAFAPARFDNLVWFKSDEIDAELRKRVRLYDGNVPLGGNLRDEIAAALKEMLAARGVSAHVSAEDFTKVAGAPDAVVFSVDNVEITNAAVQLPGASSDFLPALEAQTKRLIGLAYRAESIKNFSETNLRRIYLAKGYLRATFAPPAAEVISNEPGRTKVNVVLPITEGRQYNLASVRWFGNQAVPANELQRYLRLYPGLEVNGAKLEDDIRAIRTEYARRGYMHMQLDAKPAFNDETGAVSYTMEVKEGPLFRMGELEITGITPDAAEQVRSAWKLREGEPFDLEYVREFTSQFRLPEGAGYRLEQSEGETPETVDLTFVFCKADDPCKPTASTLYAPGSRPEDDQPKEEQP